jgi:succinate-semialdehyde dehydrogenase/glutarate-semialdehyde dehydrogenase
METPHGREGITRFTEPQTIALERLLPVAAPPFMSEETYAKVMSGALKMMRRVPGLR